MSLENYLQEVTDRTNPKYRTLNPIEERNLALKMQTNECAKNEFIEHNLRLVIHKSKEYKTKYQLNDEDRWELIQAGNFALAQGVEKFEVRGDENGGGYIKFSSFIYKKLKWEMDKSMLDLRQIRLPPNQVALSKAIYAASCEYFAVNGTYPDDEELTKILTFEGITVEKIRESRRLKKDSGVISANLPVYEDDEKQLWENLVYSDGRDESDKLSMKQLKSKLVSHMEELKDNERAILIEKYYHHLDLSTIASKLKISKERVRQGEQTALRKMKTIFKNEKNLENEVNELLI